MASITEEDSTNKWKFVILISKFVFHLIVASINKAFGVLIDEMVVVFDTDLATLGLLCSVPIALMLIACPIVARLLAHGRGSPRVVSLVGMTSGFGALMFSSYTRSCVLFGIYMTVLGIALAMGYMSCCVTLNDYYANSFVVVNTLTEIGSSVGILFIPILIERCERAYGYSGAMLIFSAIFLHQVAGSATLRPPPPEQSRTLPKMIECSKEIVSLGSGQVGAGTASHFKSTQIKSKHLNTKLGTCEGNNEAGDLKAIAELKPSGSGQGFLEDERTSLSNSEEQRCEIQQIRHERCFEEHDPKHVNSLCLPNTSESCNDDCIHNDTIEKCPLLSEGIGQTTDGTAQDSYQTERKEFDQPHSITRFFVNCIFIREPLFTLVLPVYFLTHVGTCAWMLYLIPHAEWQGIGSSKAVLLSTIGGVGALLGRIFLSVILYFGVDPFVICCISSAVASATFLIDPWVTSYHFMCMTAFLQGWTLFINTTMRASMCKITISPHNFALGYGYAALSSGIGGIAGGFAAGALYDATGSFNTVFLFLGGIHALVVLNLLIYLLIIHVVGNKSEGMAT